MSKQKKEKEKKQESVNNTRNDEKKRMLDFAVKMRKIDKLTDDEEKILNKKIFVNLLLAVAIMIYFFLINMGYKNIAKETFILDLQIFSMTLLFISIILFEQCYKKDDGKFCIYGIEMLVLAIVTLFMPYIFFYSSEPIKTICLCGSIYLSIYYVGKCIVIHKKARKSHIEELSDVKEIIKK